MKKLILVFSAIGSIALGIQSCRTVGVKPTQINVAGLISETGNWSTLGANSKAAMQLAVEDVNLQLANKKAHFRMTTSFYDTRLDTITASHNFFSAVDAKTKFFVGPQSSAELAAILPAVDRNSAIVVSQSSTAGSLAAAGDGVFRFCPPDKVEGKIMANKMLADGIQGVVTVSRNDAGNIGLQNATGLQFASRGGIVEAITPYATSVTDFSTILAAIKVKVASLSGTYGKGHTAVYIAAFDECAELFALASTDSTLSQVRWYGGDGIAVSAVLQGNAAAARFAVRTSFIAANFGLPTAQELYWEGIKKRIKNKTGLEADAFALAAYDAVWVMANTLMETQGDVTDYIRLKSEFAIQANKHTGATGLCTLDGFGDRLSGAFDYWSLTPDGSGYKWIVSGKSE